MPGSLGEAKVTLSHEAVAQGKKSCEATDALFQLFRTPSELCVDLLNALSHTHTHTHTHTRTNIYVHAHSCTHSSLVILSHRATEKGEVFSEAADDWE